MAQPDYSFTWQGTSTGNVQIKAGPTLLHTVTFGSTGAGATPVAFFNGTSSAAATTVASFSLPTPNTYSYDVVCHNGLFFGNTSSTQDMTVTWA